MYQSEFTQMYQHVLIATDGSELATKAVEHGLALAKKVGAEATIVTVTEPWSPFEMAQEAREHRPDPVGQFEAFAAAAAKCILDGAAERAKAVGISCDFVHVKDRYPAEGIMATATEKELRPYRYGVAWLTWNLPLVTWQSGV
jgi:hypothetical protein